MCYSKDRQSEATRRRAIACQRTAMSLRERAKNERDFENKYTKVNASGFFSYLTEDVLWTVLEDALATGGLNVLSAFDGIGVALLTIIAKLRIPVAKLIVIENNDTASSWAKANMARFVAETRADVTFVANIDGAYDEVVKSLGDKPIHLYLDASPCDGSSGFNRFATDDITDNAKSKNIIHSIALLRVLQKRQLTLPILVLKEYTAKFRKAHKQQLAEVFEMVPVESCASIFEAAPRLRTFYSNFPSITFAESELLSVLPNTLADVLEGRAAEVLQNRLIGTVTTGVHNEYVEQGPDLPNRPLTPRENLAAAGLPKAWAANNPNPQNGKQTWLGTGQVWAPAQVALHLAPIARAWAAIGGTFYSPDQARRWSYLA